MNLSNLNEVSEHTKPHQQEIEDFTNGLYTLARYWRGEDGAKEIEARVKKNQDNGLPLVEALIEAYGYLRPKVI